jgi:hypothetical protein
MPLKKVYVGLSAFVNSVKIHFRLRTSARIILFYWQMQQAWKGKKA